MAIWLKVSSLFPRSTSQKKGVVSKAVRKILTSLLISGLFFGYGFCQESLETPIDFGQGAMVYLHYEDDPVALLSAMFHVVPKRLAIPGGGNSAAVLGVELEKVLLETQLLKEQIENLSKSREAAAKELQEWTAKLSKVELQISALTIEKTTDEAIVATLDSQIADLTAKISATEDAEIKKGFEEDKKDKENKKKTKTDALASNASKLKIANAQKSEYTARRAAVKTIEESSINELKVKRSNLEDKLSSQVRTGEAEALAFGQAAGQQEVFAISVKFQGKACFLAALPRLRAIWFSSEKTEQFQKLASAFRGQVSLIDRPQPMAVLTLYSMQLSSHADSSSVEDVDRSLMLIQQYLREARVRQAGITLELRKRFEDAVALAAKQKRSFYAPKVLRMWEKANIKAPDPSMASTPAEILCLLALADSEYRKSFFGATLTDDPTWPSFAQTSPTWEAENAKPQKKRLQVDVVLEKIRPLLYPYGQNEGMVGPFAIDFARSVLAVKAKAELEKRLEKEALAANVGPNPNFNTKQMTIYQMAEQIKAGGLDGTPAQVYKANVVLDTREQQSLPVSREASINQFLRRLMHQYDDGLKEAVVEPMYANLARELRGVCGLEVGQLQETSLLVTNRLLARVDPKASANLAIEKKQDIVEAINLISNFYSTSNATNLIKGLNELAVDQAENERPPAVWGITSGNRFQVHPVIDPSGNAIRFRLDYVDKTVIREPDETTRPALSQIDSVTVNTEVTLDSHAVREIARYRSNARLGLPEQRFGGIPILKDIPVIQEIPLIGWFSRSYGQAPVIQQSLIFAETSVCPSIETVVSLITDAEVKDE